MVHSKTNDGTGKTVPSQIEVPNGSSGATGRSGLTSRKGSSGGQSNNNNSISEKVDRAFPKDSHDLGVMYQKYFDCTSPYDQVRFSDTQERLSIYVGEH